MSLVITDPFSRPLLDPFLCADFAMARALRSEGSGGRYYVAARGNERQVIFRRDRVRRITGVRGPQKYCIYVLLIHGPRVLARVAYQAGERAANEALSHVTFPFVFMSVLIAAVVLMYFFKRRR
jgi:hypothetical protein